MNNPHSKHRQRLAWPTAKQIHECAEFEPVQVTKSVLLATQPFFAALLLDRMTMRLTTEADGCPTAGTDGRIIIINPEFFSDLTPPQRVFVLAHEIGHAMWQHMPRARKYEHGMIRGRRFHPMIWNFAGDFIINHMLFEGNVGQMSQDECLYDPQYTFMMGIEDVYCDLYDKIKPRPPGEELGWGIPDEDLPAGMRGKGSIDEHYQAGSPPTESEQTEWRQAIASAANRAKAAGKLPGNLKQFIEEFGESQVTWQDELRVSVMNNVGNNSSSWNRPHRRKLVYPGIYTPGRVGTACGEVWIWMDTSGSISKQEYAAYFGELQAIFSECTPSCLMLGFCDAQVNDVIQVDDDHDLVEVAKKIPGGGGTSFIPPWEHMVDVGATPDMVIYLTDMYGPFPDESPWPTIWVATSDQVAPFGKTIKLDLNQ